MGNKPIKGGLMTDWIAVEDKMPEIGQRVGSEEGKGMEQLPTIQEQRLIICFCLYIT